MRVFGRLLAVVMFSSLLVVSGLASSSVAATAKSEPVTYCAVLVSKDLDSSGVSKLLEESCSVESAAAARSGLQGTLGSTLLMAWWRDAGFGGTQTTIYGNSGGCDSAGYRVEPSDYWKKNLSSIAGYNGCNRVRLYNIALTQSGAYNLQISNLGAYNDNVGLTQVYNFT
jgi:hypothetical protein